MTEPLLDRNLRVLLETADLPAAADRADALCGRFLARLQPPRRRWLRLLPAAAALLFFAVVVRSVLTPAPDAAGPGQPADAGAVERWVKELDDPSPDVREAAERRLRDLAGDAEYLLHAVEAARAAADGKARERADRLSPALRKTLGAALEHDGVAFEDARVRSLAAARNLSVFDVADLTWGGRPRTGEDLAALIIQRSGLSYESANIQFNDGLLMIPGPPELIKAAREVLHDERAAARARRTGRTSLDPLLARLSAADERALWGLADAFRHASALLDRRTQTGTSEGAARAAAVAETYRDAVWRMSRHGFHRRAAIERIRAAWPRTTRDRYLELIAGAFAPCHVRTCEVEAGTPERAKALEENDGAVYLLGGHAVGAHFQVPPPGLSLVFTVPGGAVTVVFDN